MFSFLRRSISSKELATVTRHAGLMIKSGVPLTRALEILSRQASSRLTEALLAIAEKVRAGGTFSDGLAESGRFSALYVALVRSAEVAGNLEEVLMFLAQHLEREVTLKSRVRNALLYPAVIVGAMVGIGIFMLIFVVPKLAETFESLGVELPLSTRVIIGVSAFISAWWFLMPVAIAAAFFSFRQALRTEKGQHALSWFMLHIPVLKGFVQKIQIARFARTLASLLNGGVALLEALRITRETLGNQLYRNSLAEVGRRVETGESLSGALAAFGLLYPPMIQEMVVVGEETGALTEILKHVAEFYENEITELTMSLSTLVEPVLMAVIGAGVGFFAVSMIQPMYGLLNAL